MAVDHAGVERAVHDLLLALGENPERPGLRETPRRVAGFWSEFLHYEGGQIGTTFTERTNGEMVVVTGMKVWSLCEHHLMPFWCEVSIGYIPNGQVLGLSKFARIAHGHAHKLQLQERLVSEISQSVLEQTGSRDVVVLGSGEHLCMTMRGIKTPARMMTLTCEGLFRLEPSLQSTFLNLVRPG